MTPAPSLISLFVAPLNRAGIDYMVTGGLAAVVYGHPRLTLDVDLVIRLGASTSASFAGLWTPDDFYSPPIEVVAEERARPEGSASSASRPSGPRPSATKSPPESRGR